MAQNKVAGCDQARDEQTLAQACRPDDGGAAPVRSCWMVYLMGFFREGDYVYIYLYIHTKAKRFHL